MDLGNGMIAILDDEMEYACRLMEYLRAASLSFRVGVYTSAEAIAAACREENVTLVLAAQSEYEAFQEMLPGFQGKILILGEEETYLGETIPNISKYQNAAQILETIRNLIGEEETAPSLRHGAPMRILTGFTPVSRCLQTTFLLTLGQILSEREDVLYLNLEWLSGLTFLMEQQCEGSMEELLYFLDCDAAKLPGALNRMSAYCGNLRVGPPFQNACELPRTPIEKWIRMADALEKMTNIGVLLIDLSPAVCGIPELLRRSDRVFMLQRRDAWSTARMREFEQMLQKTGFEDVLTHTLRLELPKFRSLPQDLNHLDHGELSDWVRLLLRQTKEDERK